jgi:hypothetical protein
MSKLRASIIAILTISIAITIAPAAQAGTVITISAPTHRQLDGKFLDDQLATDLAYGGSLGQLVFTPPRGLRIWEVDPALVEDAQAMAAGYQLVDGSAGKGQRVAKTWLNQLKAITIGDQIIALPFGSPSGYWINALAPHDSQYFRNISADKLQVFFNEPVTPSADYPSSSAFTLTATEKQSFKDLRNTLLLTGNFMISSELQNYKLRMAALLNPDVDTARRAFLGRDNQATSYALQKKIHLSSGRFTISTRHQNLPITVSNDFSGPAKVALSIYPTNGKVVATTPAPVLIPAKSKVQILIPVQVLTSGQSGLEIQATTTSGSALGDSVIYPLSLSVISPVATWVTTGAAILLFAAALFRSGGRLIRARKRVGNNE